MGTTLNLRRHDITARALAVGVASLLAGGAWGVEIPVANPSFESPNLATCEWLGPVPGWGVTEGGVWNPGTGTTCAPLNGFPNGVPHGDQVGWVNTVNQPLKQTVAVTVQAGAQYTLQVDVGRRSDGYPMQSYAVRLVANGIVLAQDANSLSPAPGSFQTSTVTFTVPADHPAIGAPLEIHLVLVAGPQADFDNVHLFATDVGAPPTPGDINGDSHVDATDLATLLGAWGPCSQCATCPADLNADCVVDAADLAVLLGAWTG
ncbi:MAG: hypothetical protein U0572_10250 [Phycisphaerales bacterium]